MRSTCNAARGGWKESPVPGVIQLRSTDPNPVKASDSPVELRLCLDARLSFLIGTDVAKAGWQLGIHTSCPGKRAIRDSPFLLVEGEPKSRAQSVWQHLGR